MSFILQRILLGNGSSKVCTYYYLIKWIICGFIHILEVLIKLGGLIVFYHLSCENITNELRNFMY